MPSLFDPLPIGRFVAPNRVVMAPMTRSRADSQGRPSPLAAEYYAQRSNAGLIITEGTQPSWQGQGYTRTPGIHTEEQGAGWRAIADAVHSGGGRIFVQLMHAGRIAHPLNRQTDEVAVAPSAIAPETTQIWTDEEQMQPIPEPRALDTSEIQGIVDEYVGAAQTAMKAGLDGIELHSASGYLPNQFLCSNTNQRSDRYGGSVTNRIRFVVEVLEALVGTVGADRVGVKLSPGMGFNDCLDKNPEQLYSTLVPEVSRLGLAYLHVSRHQEWDVHATLRPFYKGIYLAGGGLRSRADGQGILDAGLADATVWGWRYISNPDLVTRLRSDGPYAEPDRSTFYTPGRAGYTDYEALN